MIYNLLFNKLKLLVAGGVFYNTLLFFAFSVQFNSLWSNEL